MNRCKQLFPCVPLLFLLSIVSFADITSENKAEYQRAQQYLQKQNEVFFSFPLSKEIDFLHLTRIISLSHPIGNRMYAYANTNEFENFLKEGIEYSVERSPGEEYTENSTYKGDLDEFRGETILDYDKYIALLKKYETDHPDLCKVYEIGKSINGKEILCLRITKDLNKDDNPKRPRYLIGNAVHGNELNGTKICYGMMNFLFQGYRSGDEKATKYLEELDIWVAPHLNPDGTFPNGNTTSGCKRANSAGIDLNRDYPEPKLSRQDYENAVQRAQQETQVCMAFEKKYKFNFSIDNHDAMKTVVLHWSCKTVVPVEMPWMEYVGKKFSTPVGWTVKQAAFIYVAVGTRMDWQPFYNHCWGFCPEYENQGPNPTCTWDKYKGAFCALFDEAMCGIRGTITDASGKGVDNAKVVLIKEGKPWDKDGTEAYSRENGYFVHYAPEGTYDVEFSAGSKKKTVTGIKVTNGQPTKLDCNIDGVTGISSNPTNSGLHFSVLQRSQGIEFIVKNNSNEFGSLSIFSVTGSKIASYAIPSKEQSSIFWDGTSRNAIYTNKGCYIAQLSIQGKSISQKFIFTRSAN